MLDALVITAAVCLGIAVYTFFGVGAAWLFAGLALLTVWWGLGSPQRESDDQS